MTAAKKTNAPKPVKSLQAAPNTPKRIDTIILFGSQRLMRDGDTNAWIFTSGTTKPKRLTRRESMFINSALHAAEVQ